jgi:hypothetical protein
VTQHASRGEMLSFKQIRLDCPEFPQSDFGNILRWLHNAPTQPCFSFQPWWSLAQSLEQLQGTNCMSVVLARWLRLSVTNLLTTYSIVLTLADFRHCVVGCWRFPGRSSPWTRTNCLSFSPLLVRPEHLLNRSAIIYRMEVMLIFPMRQANVPRPSTLWPANHTRHFDSTACLCSHV